MVSNFSVYICLYRYGDKAPKSSLARSFAVVWIIVGVTVCSVMTATLSNALTNVKIEKFDVTTGKRVIFFYWNINPLDHCRRWIGKRSSTFWWETLTTPLFCFVWGYICFWFILAPSLPKASPNQIFGPSHPSTPPAKLIIMLPIICYMDPNWSTLIVLPSELSVSDCSHSVSKQTKMKSKTRSSDR